MIRIKKKRIKRLSSAVLCILTVLSLLVGAVPGFGGLTAQAAAVRLLFWRFMISARQITPTVLPLI